MIENRIDIYGDNRFPEHTKVREACRGIVKQQLMSTLAVRNTLNPTASTRSTGIMSMPPA